MKNLHTKIIIESNFIPDDVCDYIVDEIKKQEYTNLTVFDSEKTNETGETSWKLDKEKRDTQTVKVPHIYPLLHNILKRAVTDIVNPFYNVIVDSSESPQLLRYGINGHYGEHIDGEGKFNNNGIVEYRRTVDRDISFLFYLNNEYEGGELILPNQNIIIKPQKGMFVCFPSTHHFLHGVTPITKGERFAFVTWAIIQKNKS